MDKTPGGSDSGDSGNDLGRYIPSDIEQKWQLKWESDGIYNAEDHVEGKKNYDKDLIYSNVGILC